MIWIFQVSNPVPRVVHPDWLYKKVREKEDKFRQRKLVDIFSSLKKDDFLNKTCNAETNLMDENVEDLEDFPKKRRNSVNGPRPIVRCFEVNNEQKTVKTTDQVDSLRQQLEPSEVSDQQPSSQNAIDTENIDRIVDYKGWLELKKRKWKDNLDRRKKQKYIFSLTYNEYHFLVLKSTVLRKKCYSLLQAGQSEGFTPS